MEKWKNESCLLLFESQHSKPEIEIQLSITLLWAHFYICGHSTWKIKTLESESRVAGLSSEL